MQEIRPFIIALLIGLLVGIERQKAHLGKETALGIRSFLFVALLGALAGFFNDIRVGALAAFFAFALVLVSYGVAAKRSSRKSDLGITTELAAGIVFLLGYGAHKAPFVSALLGPLVALVLFSKRSLHSFTRWIRPVELQAVIILLLIGVGVMNFIENKPIDPWGIFNPYRFGILVLILAVFEFSGYVVAKILGERNSFWIVGFFAGLVSSTAVTILAARNSEKEKGTWASQMAGALAAQCGALVELIFVLGVSSKVLFLNVAAPILTAVCIALFALFWINHRLSTKTKPLRLRSPLDIVNVFRLSVLLAIILGLVAVSKKVLGDVAAVVVIFITGLFELHGVSLATATMFVEKHVSLDVASEGIILAMIASFCAKIGIIWVVGDRSKFSFNFSAILLLMAGGSGGAFLIFNKLL